MISGRYFDGKFADEINVLLSYKETDKKIILSLPHSITKSYLLKESRFSSPLGQADGSIDFDDGSCVYLAKSDYDKLCREMGRLNWLGKIEGSWLLTSTSIMAFVVIFYILWSFVIPQAGVYFADKIPQSALERMSDSHLNIFKPFLDLEETKLSEERQQEILALFDKIKGQGMEKEDAKFELLMFSSSLMNAFALPSGKIIVTDSLVKAVNDKQLMAIMAHEKAHVVQSHGMEAMIKYLGSSFILSLAIGDISQALGSISPDALFANYRSQESELEADKYAGLFCLEQWGTTAPLRNGLKIISDTHTEDSKDSKDGESHYLFPATHPSTKARIKQLKDLKARKK